MSALTLVGTVHLDPLGEDRLCLLLEQLRPALVTVDVSTYALKFRRESASELLSRLESFRTRDGRLPGGLEAVERQLREPFEYLAARQYAEHSGAEMILLGDSQVSRHMLDLLEHELMATDNLVILASRDEPPLVEQVARQWMRAARAVRHGPTWDTVTIQRLDGADRITARKIRLVRDERACVHVCGWEHLRGLAEHLADCQPECRLLRDPTDMADGGQAEGDERPGQ